MDFEKMLSWWDKIPLPLWAKLAIAIVLIALAAFVVVRWFRLKKFSLGPFEFEAKEKAAPPQPATGISQNVSAEKGGTVRQVEQKAEGSGMQQNIHAKGGTIEGVKQNAKTK